MADAHEGQHAASPAPSDEEDDGHSWPYSEEEEEQPPARQDHRRGVAGGEPAPRQPGVRSYTPEDLQALRAQPAARVSKLTTERWRVELDEPSRRYLPDDDARAQDVRWLPTTVFLDMIAAVSRAADLGAIIPTNALVPDGPWLSIYPGRSRTELREKHNALGWSPDKGRYHNWGECAQRSVAWIYWPLDPDARADPPEIDEETQTLHASQFTAFIVYMLAELRTVGIQSQGMYRRAAADVSTYTQFQRIEISLADVRRLNSRWPAAYRQWTQGVELEDAEFWQAHEPRLFVFKYGQNSEIPGPTGGPVSGWTHLVQTLENHFDLTRLERLAFAVAVVHRATDRQGHPLAVLAHFPSLKNRFKVDDNLLPDKTVELFPLAFVPDMGNALSDSVPDVLEDVLDASNDLVASPETEGPAVFPIHWQGYNEIKTVIRHSKARQELAQGQLTRIAVGAGGEPSVQRKVNALLAEVLTRGTAFARTEAAILHDGGVHLGYRQEVDVVVVVPRMLPRFRRMR